MDLNAIKSKLAALNSAGNQDREKVDFDKIYWRPANGKSTIRIVPSAYNAADPFTELKLHYNIGKFPMMSLSNYGKQDPIEEFVKELRKTSDKDNWSLSGKLSPKSRYFAPVIVRGEEDKGVRLWEFGKQVYMDLLSIAEDEDVGDYTDPFSGRDITVETAGKETTGLMYNTSTVRVRTKSTQLSEDADKVKTWLENQPDPLAQFKKYSYDEMKESLLKHLNPEEELKEQADAVETKPTGDLPWEKPAQSGQYTLNTGKAGVDSSIDDLFSDL